MTLIVTPFNEELVCMSADTQLTHVSDPSRNMIGMKINYFKSADGKFLTGYTGNDVFLESGVHVADWITNLLADKTIGQLETADVLELIRSGLDENYYYRHSGFAPLTIVIRGWIYVNSVPQCRTFRITNCEDADSNLVAPSNKFYLFEDRSRRGVLVRGALRVGEHEVVDEKVKALRHTMLSATIHNARQLVGPALYEINEAARTIPGPDSVIGENVTVAMIHKYGDGVDFAHYPDGSDYILPNFNNEFMAVKGLQVHNDPIKGGTITLDSRRLTPPFSPEHPLQSSDPDQ